MTRFVLFALTVFSLTVHALDYGAKAVVCRDRQGAVKSVELLDLWEARTLYRRPTKKSRAPVRAQVDAAIVQLKFALEPSFYPPMGEPNHRAALWGQLAAAEKDYLNPSDYFEFAPNRYIQRLRNVSLTLIGDVYEGIQPANGCALEQMVEEHWNDAGTQILINQDLVDKLDNTNKAALITHKAILGTLGQEAADINSIRTRRAVGYIFSGHELPKLDLPKTSLRCQNRKDAPTTVVDFFMSGDGKTVLSVTEVAQHIPAIGYFASHPAFWSDPKSLEDIFPSDLCANPNVDNTYPVSLGSDPVSFQNANTFTVFCESGQPKITFNLNGYKYSPEERKVGSETMTCAMVNN